MLELIPNTMAIDPEIIELIHITGQHPDRKLVICIKGQDAPLLISRNDHADVNVDLLYSKIMMARETKVATSAQKGIPTEAKRAAGQLRWAIAQAETLLGGIPLDNPAYEDHKRRLVCAKNALDKLMALARSE